MTPEQRLELVKRFYALNSAGDQVAAQELLTDDFFITVPATLPFGGVYRGKTAMQQLIPIVAAAVPLAGLDFIATTVGDDHAVEIVEFRLLGDDAEPFHVTEVIHFRGNQICEIRPYYFDVTRMAAAAQRKAAAVSNEAFAASEFPEASGSR